MPIVLRSVFENLDSAWNVIIFHGTGNKEWLERLIDEKFKREKSRISLKDMKRPNVDVSEYNSMMMSREILEQIPTELFLIVQTDSMLCKGNGDLLKEFMMYDYVGAPWRATQTVGNGGLSLRRKSRMLEIVDKCSDKSHNEDGFFSGGCDGVRPNLPSYEQAKRFSIESVYNDKSFGVHKAWMHLPEYEGALNAQCPGLNELKELHNQFD
jgi:hypothetical protein